MDFLLPGWLLPLLIGLHTLFLMASIWLIVNQKADCSKKVLWLLLANIIPLLGGLCVIILARRKRINTSFS